MRAAWVERFGGPEQVELRDVDAPQPAPDELLVRVHAVSLNGADAEMLTGTPIYGRFSAGGVFRPGRHVYGSDVAGVVEAVGSEVDGFAVGDAVLGDIFEIFGGLAELVCAPAKLWVHKPEALGFVEASVLPQAGVLALQATRDQVQLGPDSRVLVVGAGGGVGVFTVQMAQKLGAHVTAVDNGAKQELLAELGANRCVDHTVEGVLADGSTWDLIVDAVAAYPPGAYRRALNPGGACVVVGGHLGRLLGFVLYGLVLRLFSDKRIGLLMWDRAVANLEAVVERAVADEIEPVIDGVFSLEQAGEAFRRLTERKARGKVVVQLIEG